MLDKLWDDIVAGPQPERGLDKLRRLTTNVKGIIKTLIHNNFPNF
jgi:hypothetical protein